MSDSLRPQAPLSMELSRQEYWSGLPFSSPGDLPNSGIEPGSPPLQADSYRLSHQGSPQHLLEAHSSTPDAMEPSSSDLSYAVSLLQQFLGPKSEIDSISSSLSSL